MDHLKTTRRSVLGGLGVAGLVPARALGYAFQRWDDQVGAHAGK
jgi:hypothetical protein